MSPRKDPVVDPRERAARFAVLASSGPAAESRNVSGIGELPSGVVAGPGGAAHSPEADGVGDGEPEQRRRLFGRLLAPKETDTEAPREPLYPRLLRLRHVYPSGVHRALLVEGTAFVGLLGALADKASWWAPVVLPAAAAVVVKFHDVIAGIVGPRPPRGGTGEVGEVGERADA